MNDSGTHSAVVADTPLLEVESSPPVPNVLTRFRRTVETRQGRGFCLRLGQGRGGSSAVAAVERSYSRMEPKELVEILIQADGPVSARSLIEASVHLPRRGSRWVAAFRDETGRQVSKTTRLRDRNKALTIALEWEAAAARKRAAQGALPRKPTIRVRAGSAEQELGLRSQREVAAYLRISTRAVREIERRAFDKLRRHPALRDFWREWQTGEIKETILRASELRALSGAEIAAVYALARTPEERLVVRKLIALTQAVSASGAFGRAQ